MLSSIIDIWTILKKRDRYILFGFLILLIIQGSFELLGVVSILPLFSVISNPNLIDSNPKLNLIYNYFNFTNLNNFLIFLTLGSLILISSRIIITFLSNFLINRFIRKRTHTISLRLLKSYVGQPYDFFLNNHSSELGKRILSEVEDVTIGCLYPSLQLLQQLNILIFLIFGALAFAPPLIIFSILSILVFYGIIFYFLSNKIENYGSKKFDFNSKRYRIIQEVFAGIKEIKLSCNESIYLSEYDKFSKKYSQILIRLGLLIDFPKYLLEFLSIVFILLIVLILTGQGDGDLEKVLPTLSAIALGGLRILPAIQKTYQSFLFIKFSGPAVKTLKKDITKAISYKPNLNIDSIRIKEKITFKNVSFIYENSKSPSLKNISFEIKSNTIIGIVGTTGAGKSTILDLLSGLLSPTAGTISIDENNLEKINKRSWQKSIGYVPQQIFISDDTITKNIALGINNNDIDFEKIKIAAQKAMIYDFIMNSLPKRFETKLGENGVRISGGQRQRIGLARAFYLDPNIIILDEATNSLDTLTESKIINSLHNNSMNKTLIMISHRLSTVRNCEKIFFIEKGKIKHTGNFEELMKIQEFKKFSGI